MAQDKNSICCNGDCNQGRTCPVRLGTYKPAEAVHQIEEPQPEALRLAKELVKPIDGFPEPTTLELSAAAELIRLHAKYEALKFEIAAAPQAVQAAVPEAIEQMAVDRYKVVPSHESMFHRWAVVAGNGTQQLYIGREVECQNMALKFAGAFLDGAFVAMQNTAPAHPAEGVPPQASEWDGKLPERLQSVLNALRLELPAAVVNDVEFEVRSHYEAMHTSLSTSRRMYGAARDRLEAIDAAQPDPFAATQPAAQGMEADLTDAQIDEAFNQMPDGAAGFLKSWGYRQFARAVLAAQAKQGGA